MNANPNLMSTRAGTRWLAALSLLALLWSGCSDSTDGAGTTDTGGGASDIGGGETGDAVDDTGGSDVGTPDVGGTKDTGGTADAADDAAGQDTVEPPPTFEFISLSPESGPTTGGTTVLIEGTGFVSGAVVYFGASLAQNVVVLGPKRITCASPPSAGGLVDVRVQLPPASEGAPSPEVTLESAFLYYQAVDVTSVDPAVGPADGGDRVTITGKGFEAGSQVIFGPRPAVEIDIIDSNTIEATVPMGEPGDVNVHVSNKLGIGTLNDGYFYYDEPRMDVISPAAGPLAGGNDVIISGTAFLGDVTVWFGDMAAEIMATEGTTKLQVRVPPGAALGAVDVELETGYGTAMIPDGYAYIDPTLGSGPTNLLAIAPSTGPISGGTIVEIAAYGLNSAADTLVLFGDGFAGEVLDVDPAQLLVRVKTPAVPAPGAVDVTLVTSNGTSTKPNGFTYLPEIQVKSVTPAIGPVSGGTFVTIKGKGFEPGATVRFGALASPDVTVVDGTTIEAVSPQGAAGYVTVVVKQGAIKGALPQGFFYQGSGTAIYVVDPNSGSIAGGTYVQIIGQGFSGQAEVLFDGNPASHITVVDSTLITCKTPPGQVGTIHVEVKSTGGNAFFPDSFTYFNPENSLGGTWGTSVQGALNITVRDSQSQAPVPDAFVILGVNPTTPYQGFTNLQGQITFSGPDVDGEQVVSASKQAYESNTVVDFDAENLTILLTPIPPPTPGAPPPGVAPPLVSGKLFGLSKYTILPLGNCANKLGVPAPLCQSCTTDAQCGAGNKCSKLQANSSIKNCTTPCVSGSDCPAGFVCGSVQGSPQCVPSPGQKVARCYGTKPNIFSDDIEAILGESGPNGLWQVTEDGQTYTVYAYPPQTAIVCFGGYVDSDTAEFVPLTLGVARNVFAQPGETTEDTDIELQFQLNRSMTVSFANEITPGPEGPNFTGLFTYLDLGLDGVIEFKHALQTGILGQSMLVPRMIDKLTGSLIDASFTFLGGAFSATPDNTPVSLTLARNVKDIATDVSYRLSGAVWGAIQTGIIDTIRGVWGHGATGIYAVGDRGMIAYFGGGGWTYQSSPVSANLNGIWGWGPSSAVAVGDTGTVVTFNGVKWTAAGDIGTTSKLNAVWGSSPDNVFAVGSFEVAHFNGATWNANPPATAFQGTAWDFQDVHGVDANHIWMVGNSGRITQFDGSSWVSTQISGVPQLRGVWAVSPTEVFAVGLKGVIYRYNGTLWEAMESPTTNDLFDVWAADSGHVYAVGARGTLLHFNGADWVDQSPAEHLNPFTTVFGWAPGEAFAMGANEFVIGPLLEVPLPVAPTNGQLYSKYEINIDFAEGAPASFQYMNLTIPGLMGDTPEWFIFTDGHVKDVPLPEFPVIEGTPGIAGGPKNLLILRAYKPDFDIDNYDYTDLNTLQWRSWAYDQIAFTKN